MGSSSWLFRSILGGREERRGRLAVGLHGERGIRVILDIGVGCLEHSTLWSDVLVALLALTRRRRRSRGEQSRTQMVALVWSSCGSQSVDEGS
ncbi:hypothetical protein HYQ46_003848 [Verticillium longisporum]|nr:hypothetical protein HYQ46_003848 [Verticillium longisporum]